MSPSVVDQEYDVECHIIEDFHTAKSLPAELFAMLEQKECNANSVRGSDESSKFVTAYSEVDSWPLGDSVKHVTVARKLNRDTLGQLVHDVVTPYAFQSIHGQIVLCHNPLVFQEQDIGVLSERHQLAFDVVGCCFVARGEDVVWDHEAGGDVDGLIVDTF